MSATNDFPFRLAAIDVDDTLVGSDKHIHPRNRDALLRLQERGCRLLLASGRRHANVVAYAAELGLDDFVVSCQGARVQHVRTAEVLHGAVLPPDLVRHLVAEGLRRGHIVFIWQLEGIFSNAPSPFLDLYYEETRDEPVSIADLDPLTRQPAEKIVWAADTAVVHDAHDEFRDPLAGRASLTITNDWALEFTAPDANKDNGVAAVALHYDVPREQVIAFGDGNNDARLLAWAGLGIAMPHARPAARQAADRIAPDGDPNTALARALDPLL